MELHLERAPAERRPPSVSGQGSVILPVVLSTAVTVVLLAAAAGKWAGRFAPSGVTEVVAVVLYAVSVWLAVRNSIWTWPTGIVSTTLYLWLFFDWGLYADAGLQVVFVGMSLAGLWAWRRRTQSTERPQVEHVPLRTAALVGVGVVAGTVLIRSWLLEVGGSAPLWDALLAAGSLGALFLLVRKYIETWWMWMGLDIAYVGLFVSRDVWLSAALYLVLLLMAVRAFHEWRPLLRA